MNKLSIIILFLSNHTANCQVFDSIVKLPLTQKTYEEMKIQSIIGDEINEAEYRLPADEIYEKPDKRRKLFGPSQFDSRIEVRTLNPDNLKENEILQNTKSVGIILDKSLLSKVSDSMFHLDLTSKLGDLYRLCEKEAFRNQPVAGIGTSFVTSDQLMTTAAHVFSGPLSNYAVVFGFQMINKVGAYESFIPSNNIFYPQEISYKSEELDIAIFKVDRFFDRKILPHEEAPITKDTEVYMIGHPMGIPQKVAVNARVYDISHPEYFYTTLDAFQGNSGSPVFNANTHKVIGVLVSGELDYRWNGQCNESTLCKLPYCKGEKVIRMDRIIREFD